jgi:hypothetical protein
MSKRRRKLPMLPEKDSAIDAVHRFSGFFSSDDTRTDFRITQYQKTATFIAIIL